MPVRLTPLGWRAGLSFALAGRHPAYYIISCYGGIKRRSIFKDRKARDSVLERERARPLVLEFQQGSASKFWIERSPPGGLWQDGKERGSHLKY